MSTATVSYVLSGRADEPDGPRVGEATRLKVRKAAQELGYRVNTTARALRTGRSGIVLMRHARISNPVAHALIELAYRAFDPIGMTLLVLPEADWSDFLENNFVDVAYLDSVDAASGELAKLTDLAERGMKIVVNDPQIEPNGFDVIRLDHVQALHLVMDHLTKYERIGFIGASQPGHKATNLLAHYTAYLAEHRLESDDSWVALASAERFNAGFDAALQVLRQPHPPRALVTHNDQFAAEAVHVAQYLGMNVPRDIAIAGIGNTVMASAFRPRLTTAGPTGTHVAIVDRMVQFATGSGPPPGLLHTQPIMLSLRESA